MKILQYLFFILCLLIFLSCKESIKEESKEIENEAEQSTNDVISEFQIPDSLFRKSIIIDKNKNGYFRIFVAPNENNKKAKLLVTARSWRFLWLRWCDRKKMD